jgi:predicted house-cleaning NTP pyrophosphatase (Maf/HAM1 superfamily)
LAGEYAGFIDKVELPRERRPRDRNRDEVRPSRARLVSCVVHTAALSLASTRKIGVSGRKQPLFSLGSDQTALNDTRITGKPGRNGGAGDGWGTM